ncbi:MAG: hypothetical protein H7Z72_00580 [Bacteroidetes bacterium]|nr:hypothetical protein [Fibrella sp.]
MNALTTVLRKTIVGPFYRQNAGLFFVVLMLAGSFLRAGDHVALAEAAVHSPLMLGLYQAFWVLYTVFATRFAVGVIQRTDILYQFRLIPMPRRWLGWLAVQYALLAPILAYTAFVGWISGQQGTTGSTWQLTAGAVVMLISPLFWLDHTLRTPNRQPLVGFGGGWHNRFTTPYLLFFIRYLTKNQLMLLVLTKGGTGLLMLGVLNLYPTDDYDIRLLNLGALLVGVGHSTMAYHLYQFEHERLALLRNLPVQNSRRLLHYAVVMAVLLVPEAILLLRYWPIGVSLGALAGVWAFGHSVFLLQFTLLLPRHRSLDQLMPVVSGLLLLFFLCIMYRLPGWGLSLFNWLAATVLFIRFYLKSVWVTEAPE